jgi:hypothetical protein
MALNININSSFSLNLIVNFFKFDIISMLQVQRCNAAGVNVIVDFVVNQMAGGSGKGTGGTDHNAGTFVSLQAYISIVKNT